MLLLLLLCIDNLIGVSESACMFLCWQGVKHSDCDSMSLKLAMYAETVGFWLDNAATLKSAHDSSGSMSS